MCRTALGRMLINISKIETLLPNAYYHLQGQVHSHSHNQAHGAYALIDLQAKPHRVSCQLHQ